MLGIRGRGRMNKGELASAILATDLPSRARVLPLGSAKASLAAALGPARRSCGFVLPLVVAAFACALGAAMPLLVYGTGSRAIEEVEGSGPVRDLGASSARSLVAVRAPERAQPAEQKVPGERLEVREQGPDERAGPPSGPALRGSSDAEAAQQTSFTTHARATPTHAAGASIAGPAAAEPTAASDQAEDPPVALPGEETGGTTDDGAKVTLCHKPGPNGGTTITVGESAVPTHLAHGDTVGACAES